MRIKPKSILNNLEQVLDELPEKKARKIMKRKKKRDYHLRYKDRKHKSDKPLFDDERDAAEEKELYEK